MDRRPPIHSIPLELSTTSIIAPQNTVIFPARHYNKDSTTPHSILSRLPRCRIKPSMSIQSSQRRGRAQEKMKTAITTMPCRRRVWQLNSTVPDLIPHHSQGFHVPCLVSQVHKLPTPTSIFNKELQTVLHRRPTPSPSHSRKVGTRKHPQPTLRKQIRTRLGPQA